MSTYGARSDLYRLPKGQIQQKTYNQYIRKYIGQFGFHRDKLHQEHLGILGCENHNQMTMSEHKAKWAVTVFFYFQT